MSAHWHIPLIAPNDNSMHRRLLWNEISDVFKHWEFTYHISVHETTVKKTKVTESRDFHPDAAAAAARCHRCRTSSCVAMIHRGRFMCFCDADRLCSEFPFVVAESPVDFLVSSPSNQSISQYWGKAGCLQRDFCDGNFSREMNNLTLHGWSTIEEKREAAAAVSCCTSQTSVHFVRSNEFHFGGCNRL